MESLQYATVAISKVRELTAVYEAYSARYSGVEKNRRFGDSFIEELSVTLLKSEGLKSQEGRDMVCWCRLSRSGSGQSVGPRASRILSVRRLMPFDSRSLAIPEQTSRVLSLPDVVEVGGFR